MAKKKARKFSTEFKLEAAYITGANLTVDGGTNA